MVSRLRDKGERGSAHLGSRAHAQVVPAKRSTTNFAEICCLLSLRFTTSDRGNQQLDIDLAASRAPDLKVSPPNL